MFKNNKEKIIEKVKKTELSTCLKEIDKYKKWEKYKSGILNSINSIQSSMTAPKRIGQLSELILEYSRDFQHKTEEKNPHSYKEWYLNKENVFEANGIETKSYDIESLGTNKTDGKSIFENVVKRNIEAKKIMLDALNSITDSDIETYISELMFDKSFFGLLIEEPIAIKVFKTLVKESGKKFHKEFSRKSSSNEESKGIDYVYDDPDNKILLQIKPSESEWYRKMRSGIPEINNNCFLIEYETDKKNNDTINLIITKPRDF